MVFQHQLLVSVRYQVNTGPVSLIPFPFDEGSRVLKFAKSLLNFHDPELRFHSFFSRGLLMS